MKILIVLNDLDIGGAQNYTISLMNNFSKLGHTISLKVLSGNIPLAGRLNSKIDLKVWPRKHKIDFEVFGRIFKEINNNNYDAIISSYPLYLKLFAFFFKKRTLFIYPIHTTITRDKKTTIFNYIIFKIKSKNEIFVTSINNQTKYLQEKYYLRNGFFKEIYNGVDINLFIPRPNYFNRVEFLNKYKIDSKKKIILMVAGFRPEKRHIDAFKAFSLLKLKEKNIYLICVGDNRLAEKKQYQNFVQQNSLNDIKILSANELEEIREFYWSADIFTLTSNKVETFPISALEAMSCGLPVVLTNIGGAADLIKENVNGFLAVPEDINSIAESWLKALQLNTEVSKAEIRKIVIQNYCILKSSNEYLRLIRETNVN